MLLAEKTPSPKSMRKYIEQQMAFLQNCSQMTSSMGRGGGYLLQFGSVFGHLRKILPGGAQNPNKLKNDLPEVTFE